MRDVWLEELEQRRLASQMFDPPLTGRISVVGSPVLSIPESGTKYASFLTWWMEVGRLRPTDPQGWSTYSGPRVMWNRVEAIPEEEWAGLPPEEQMH